MRLYWWKWKRVCDCFGNWKLRADESPMTLLYSKENSFPLAIWRKGQESLTFDGEGCQDEDKSDGGDDTLSGAV